MPEYIDREVLLKKIFPLGILTDLRYTINAQAVRYAIEGCKKADVQEVKHGTWINVRDYGGGECYGNCSNCGTQEKAPNPTAFKMARRYCSYCGAIMDGKNKNLPKRCKCGSKAELVNERDDKHRYYYVYCTGCEKTTGQFATDVEAVNCWNGEDTSE